MRCVVGSKTIYFCDSPYVLDGTHVFNCMPLREDTLTNLVDSVANGHAISISYGIQIMPMTTPA